MRSPDPLRGAAEALLDRDDVDGVLSGRFYTHDKALLSNARPKTIKPEHYKVICISMYTEDLAKLDSMVEELKRRGLTKASRSALIRHALSQVDLDRVPRGI